MASIEIKTVILSGVDASRSEASTESKDPLQVCSELGLARSSHDADSGKRTP